MSQESRERKEEQPKFEIREGGPNDAVRIAEIQRDSWFTTYVNEEEGITRDDLATRFTDMEARASRWRKMLEEAGSEKTHIFVVTDGDEVAGFCRVERKDGVNYIDALYLDPTQKGKGAGAKVFSEALAWLGEENPATLEVASYNSLAIDFYKRFGFHEDGEGVPFPIVDGKIMRVMKMTRDGKKK